MNRLVASVCFLVLGVAGGVISVAGASGTDADFTRQLDRWKKQRLEGLRSESGWLTLVGLHWLEPGENPFGSNPANRVVLPQGKAPARAGAFFLNNGKVRVVAAPGSGITLNGKPVNEQDLRSDESGEPDILHLGDLSLYVIKRGERFAIRVKDPNSPVRKEFKGIDAFPPNPAYRIVAEFVPYDPPREVAVPTILGTTEKMKAPGYVKFKLARRELTLEPVVEDPEHPQLFFIFKDATSGKETYPAGRFLYADMPKDGRVVLDFNRAYNPPCAFTPYATCPLPPKQNRLDVRIEAGEKTYGEHHLPAAAKR